MTGERVVTTRRQGRVSWPWVGGWVGAVMYTASPDPNMVRITIPLHKEKTRATEVR